RSSSSTASTIAPGLRPAPRSSPGSPGTTASGCTRPTTTCHPSSGNSTTPPSARYHQPWPHNPAVHLPGESPGGAAARKLEAAYLTPDVVEQRRATLQALALRPGERVLDVGSGPGLLALEMAQVVGLAGHVIGIDVSDAMLALGQRRCASVSGTGRLSFVKADATALPFPDAAFDAAVSIQVYEYVADLPNALA